MSFTIEGFSLGIYAADVDMSTEATWQFAPVWLGAAANITGFGVGGAALQAIGSFTGPPLGILQNNPVAGEAGNVMVWGVSKAKSGGNANVGDPLGWNAGGAGLIKAVSTKFAIGTALENMASGDITSVLLYPRGVQ